MPDREIRPHDIVACPICGADAVVNEVDAAQVTVRCIAEPPRPRCTGVDRAYSRREV